MCKYPILFFFFYTLMCVAGDFQLAVMVTAEGKLVLTVMLQTAIPGPVRLRIKYTWVVQPDAVEQTSSTTFENMREIVHQISRSAVPFQQFRLQVALQVGRVVGPFVPNLENVTAISKYSKCNTHSQLQIVYMHITMQLESTFFTNSQPYHHYHPHRQCHPQNSLLHFLSLCHFLSS